MLELVCPLVSLIVCWLLVGLLFVCVFVVATLTLMGKLGSKGVIFICLKFLKQ